jgi:hypothetical protein
MLALILLLLNPPIDLDFSGIRKSSLSTSFKLKAAELGTRNGVPPAVFHFVEGCNSPPISAPHDRVDSQSP